MKNNISEQFEINQMETESDLSTRREEALSDYNSCILCGTELEFTHTVDRELKFVSEKGTCPACRIQLKTKFFALH